MFRDDVLEPDLDFEPDILHRLPSSWQTFASVEYDHHQNSQKCGLAPGRFSNCLQKALKVALVWMPLGVDLKPSLHTPFHDSAQKVFFRIEMPINRTGRQS